MRFYSCVPIKTRVAELHAFTINENQATLQPLRARHDHPLACDDWQHGNT